MSITVRELLQLPHLQAVLLAGDTGIDRDISWVHTSDLPNAWEWQGPGELLLTNGTGLPVDPAGQVEFIERLAATGATGLAAGGGVPGPTMTPALLRRAADLDLPVLTVPFSVPFTSVVRAVATANEREESRQLLVVARLYELLRQSIAVGSAGPGLLERLGHELGVRLYLVDPVNGRSLLDNDDENPYAASLAAGFAQHGQALPGMLRLTRDDDPHQTAVAVGVPTERPTALVIESFGHALPSTVLLQHAAAVGALELAQLTARQERQRRAGGDLLGQLLDRRIDDDTAISAVGALGLALAECVIVATRAQLVDTDPAGELTRSRLPHLTVLRDGYAYFLVPALALADAGTGTGTGTENNTADRWLAGSVAGVSDTVGRPARAPEAAAEAGWALSASEAEGRSLLHFGEGTILLPRTVAEAEAIVARVLGPLLAHDERTGEYLKTVRVILELDRSWQAAAAQLHIHKQTLGYRLRKIEALTGRGFVRTEHLAEWWMALRAYDMLAGLGTSRRVS